MRTNPYVLLSGPPGAGKSTIAQALSHLLQEATLIDLDQYIHERYDQSPAEIIQEKGELHFRQAEQDALASIAESSLKKAPGPIIISLGGGALTVKETRKIARKMGPVIGLKVPLETLRARLSSSPTVRPLSRQGRGLEDLLNRRKHTYASVDLTIEANNRAPAVIAEDLLQPIENLGVHVISAQEQDCRLFVSNNSSNMISAVAGAILHHAEKAQTILLNDRSISEQFVQEIKTKLQEFVDVKILDNSTSIEQSTSNLVIAALGQADICLQALKQAQSFGPKTKVVCYPSTINSFIQTITHDEQLLPHEIIVDLPLLKSSTDHLQKTGLPVQISSSIINKTISYLTSQNAANSDNIQFTAIRELGQIVKQAIALDDTKHS